MTSESENPVEVGSNNETTVSDHRGEERAAFCKWSWDEVVRQKKLITDTKAKTLHMIYFTRLPFSTSWMGSLRIYKITLSLYLFWKVWTWQDWSFAKRALWASFRKSMRIFWEKLIGATWGRVDWSILTLPITAYVKYCQIEGMKENYLHRYHIEEPHFSCLYHLHWGSVRNRDNWLSFFMSVAYCHLSALVF